MCVFIYRYIYIQVIVSICTCVFIFLYVWIFVCIMICVCIYVGVYKCMSVFPFGNRQTRNMLQTNIIIAAHLSEIVENIYNIYDIYNIYVYI